MQNLIFTMNAEMAIAFTLQQKSYLLHLKQLECEILVPAFLQGFNQHMVHFLH